MIETGQKVERWMSTGTAAKALGVDRRTVHRYAEGGRVLARQLPSGRWQIAFPVRFLAAPDEENGTNGTNGTAK